MIAHVVRMVALAVEQLHADRYFVLFSNRGDALQSDRAILKSLLVTHAFAVARKTDHVREARVGNYRRVLFKVFDNFVVILDAIQSLGNTARNAANHGAFEIEFLERGKIFY